MDQAVCSLEATGFISANRVTTLELLAKDKEKAENGATIGALLFPLPPATCPCMYNAHRNMTSAYSSLVSCGWRNDALCTTINGEWQQVDPSSFLPRLSELWKKSAR